MPDGPTRCFEIGPLSCAVDKADKLLTAGERSALVFGEMGGWEGYCRASSASNT